MEMTINIDWAAIPNAYKGYVNKIADRFKQGLDKASKDAADEFLAIYKNKVESIYKDVVDSFYGDYTPHYYDRTGDLYKLLEIEVGKQRAKPIIHKERLWPSNDGIDADGLYDLVFVGGWHGGAPSGPDHPSPGTPYWRAPYPQYYEWYRPAYKSPSMWENLVENYDAYLAGEASEEWQNIFLKHFYQIKLF